MEGSPLKVVLPVDTPPSKEALYKENIEVKTRVDEWLTSAQNKEEVENSKEEFNRVAASASILTSDPFKQDQLQAAEVANLAQNSAAEFLASQN